MVGDFISESRAASRRIRSRRITGDSWLISGSVLTAKVNLASVLKRKENP
jgi:hypothetical protein